MLFHCFKPSRNIHRFFKQVLKQHKINYSYIRSSNNCTVTGMELNSVIAQLELCAPTSLAEGWDNVGLLVEPTSPHRVNSIMLTNDLTENVLEEAVSKKINLIVSYHPPIFKSLKRVTQENWKDRILVKSIENRIAIYSPHTSFDIIQGGVNDWLMSCFNGECQPIKPKDDDAKNGAGRICRLTEKTKFADIVQLVKTHLNLKFVRVAYPINAVSPHLVSSIASCAGSGGSVLNNIPADVYLTGELSHHEILDATSTGKYVILCEHSNTERGYLTPFAVQLENLLQNKVQVMVSQRDKEPVEIL